MSSIPSVTSRASQQVLADPAALRERLDRLDEDHVWPLNDYVRHLRKRRGGGETVPWFDPAGGGVNARVLFLLEAPGPMSVSAAGLRTRPGTGIISADNPDETAANTLRLAEEAWLPRHAFVNWNVVPWYLGDERSIVAAKYDDVAAGAVELRAVLRLLPALRVVVLMGRPAQRGWGAYMLRERTDVVAVPCVHPSPRAVNRYPDAWRRALGAVQAAVAVARLDD